jgi:hypothetical protein
MFKASLLGAVGSAMLFSAVNAATETYDFLGHYAGTYYDSKDFLSDMGNTVTVTMGTFDKVITDGASGGGKVGQWTGYGLGVCTLAHHGYCKESHFVDGRGKNEYLKFSFDKDVTIESIKFKDYGDNFFDLTLGDMTNKLDLKFDAYGLFTATIDAMGDFFAIGAYNAKSGFKVQSITVSYDEGPSEVPLPAAGWMLIAGVGGLVAMKRRGRNAA